MRSGTEATGGTGWLRVWRPRPAARARLLCLPPAGSPAALYRPWAELIPPSVELAAVEPPGHGTRYGEPFPASFAEVTEAVTSALARLPERPTAVYGHSLGTVPALDIARALDRAGRPPAALLVSSRNAPSAPGGPPAAGLTDRQLLGLLRELSGTDERVLADPGLTQALLPVLRADIALLAAYTYTPGPPLGCPVRVYAGLDDTTTTPAGLAAWRRENPRDFRIHRLPGGHFFFRGRERSFLARLVADIAPPTAAGEGTFPPWQASKP
ncbi:thioesterase [Streptomyces mashuensis]|uniref:Thioesterase n=1 Tax=Streptomyces mashuensis TaxID=33904 RepID=A0A919EFH1_9ACTN|nr:thioesterase domain-containing protein [Streptomyces mashuensis]GHF65610.1 thioesterase [Streptomyces mashuensis]